MTETILQYVMNSKTPVELNGPAGEKAYIIDMAAYRRLTDDEKNIYRQRVEGIFSQTPMRSIPLEEARDQRNRIRSSLDKAEANQACCAMACAYPLDKKIELQGGVLLSAEPATHMIIIDHDADILGALDDGTKSRLKFLSSFPYKAFLQSYVLHHEIGHMLGKGQSGADFYGFSIALQEIQKSSPEKLAQARALSNFIADQRIENEIFYQQNKNDSDAGFQCYKAIREIAQMSDAELAAFDTAAILSRADKYDQEAKDWLALKENRPEQKVYQWYNKARKDNKTLFSIANEIASEDPPFPPGSAEFEVLESFISSQINASAPPAAEAKPEPLATVPKRS